MVEKRFISRISCQLADYSRAVRRLIHKKLWIVVCGVWVECLQLGYTIEDWGNL